MTENCHGNKHFDLRSAPLLTELLLLILMVQFVCADEAWHTLPRHEIKPCGWIKHQLERNLTSGNLSVYDELRGLGAPVGPGKTRGYTEFEGNYFDALVRNAFLTGHQPSIEKATRIITNALSKRQANGYFGRERVRTPGDVLESNLELWSQCCFLRGALAYYEHTGNPQVFEAITNNVNLFLSLFEKGSLRYFQKPTDEPIIDGARTHGLMYVDVLEKLFELTGDRKYVGFAKSLYDDYSASPLKNADNKLDHLLDREAMFQEHAPHTAEHFRVPFFLAYETKDPRYQQAVQNVFYKLEKSLSPSRMLVADPLKLESVAGNFGSDTLPYEYCTITELLTSLASALQKTRRSTLGDDIEVLLFNAAQGARFPDGKANAYYAKDSQWVAVFDESHAATFRYQYAALHSIGCCPINSHRILPAYVENMWMISTDRRTLIAALHGASEVITTLAGQRVNLVSATDYPFGNRVEYQITPETPVEFSLLVRSPAWSQQTRVEAPGARVEQSTNFIRVTRIWHPGDRIVVDFDDPIQVKQFRNNGHFVQKGALIYALGFPTEKIRTKEFLNGAFANYNLKLSTPGDRAKFFGYRLPATSQEQLAEKLIYHSRLTNQPAFPFETPPGMIESTFIWQRKEVRAELLPMGSLLLRKVLFEQDK